MNKRFPILIMIVFIITTAHLKAQLTIPGATPTAKSEIVVGQTTVTLEYSRPSKNGRKIFGGLVPKKEGDKEYVKLSTDAIEEWTMKLK